MGFGTNRMICVGALGGALGVAVTANFALRQGLGAVSPYFFFVAAVVACVLLGGYVAGVLAVIVMTAAAAFTFEPVGFEFDSAKAVSVAMYAAEAAAVVALLVWHERRLRRRSEAAVKASDSRFRVMAESVPLGVFRYDASGHITYANAHLINLLGMTAESAVSDDRWIAAVHEEDRPRVIAQWLHATAEGMPFSSEHRFTRPDGQLVWARVNAAPVPGVSSGISGYVGTIEDVTARHAVGEQMRQAKDIAEAASRTKSNFLASVSHEIRTPLTALMGYAELLQADELTEAERAEAVRTISRNGRHLLTIVNEILDLSKIEAGKLTLDRQPVDLPALLRETIELVRHSAAEKRLRLTLVCDTPVPAIVRTDATRLRQVLLNLLGNAIKFTPAGSVTLHASYDDAAGWLSLAVSDTGPGLAQEQLDRLFEPYAQAAGVCRVYGGTGLGLVISRQFARLMGGDVVARSTPGVGSTFTVTLDAGDIIGVPRVSECTAPVLQCFATPTASKHRLIARVLVADDSTDHQSLVAHVLRSAGATVDLADNGRQAKKMVLAAAQQGQPYAVVLMDVQMPELDGLSAVTQLRAGGYTGPIVALTGNAMPRDRDACVAAGCDEYLAKPVCRDDLIEMVTRYAPASENDGSGPLGGAAPDPIVHRLAHGLEQRVREIERAARAGRTADFRRLVHRLRGTAQSHHLPEIATCAEALERTVCGDQAENFVPPLRVLADVCRRLA